MKFTERSIAKLKPGTSGQQLYWDDDLKGFGVLVSSKTGSKTYVVQRAIKGRTRRITVARTNVLSLSDAEKRAKEILAVFYKGHDPKNGRRDHTLRSALEEYLRVRQDLRPRSAQGYRDSVERHLSTWLDIPLRTITREMVEDKLRKIAGGIAKETDHSGHATANGVMRIFRLLYAFAHDRAPHDDPMPSNPVRLKKVWFPSPRRTRSVKADQLKTFYEAVCKLENKVAADYIKLLLFTGFRRREADCLTWDRVDFNERVIRLAAADVKGKRKLDLPMSDFVHDLLVARRSLGNAKFVFPSASKSGHIEEPKFPLKQIAKATGIYVSAHDLRRTFITVAESTEMSVMALKALVNHSLKGLTESYVQMDHNRLREPAQRVADELKKLCGIEPVGGGNVKKMNLRG
jgi:integrase